MGVADNYAVLLPCSPAKAGEEAGDPTDHRGWDEYGNDWRNYFECMLAPVAQQAAGARARRCVWQKQALWRSSLWMSSLTHLY
jgi:hypothetical protein